MQPWRCDPYLWVHLAGLATVPLWIDLCLLGLAVGTPTLPGLELAVMIALGVLPVLVMQLRQPFYIFSLPGLALRPTALQDDQRRLLTQFRRWRVRVGALLVPLPLVWVLVKLYPLAFLAREITPFGDWGRLGGVVIAALGFFFANLFLQVPVAVLQVLATPDRRMQTVVPYPVDKIAADFTWFGLAIGKIFPTLALSESDASAADEAETLLENFSEDIPEDIPEDLPEGVNQAEASSEPLSKEGVEHLHLTEAAAALAEAETLGEQVTPEVVPAAEHAAVDAAVADSPKLSHPDSAHPDMVHPETADPETSHSEITHPGMPHPEMAHPEIDETPRGEAAMGDASMAALPPVPVEALDGEEKGFPVLDTMTRQK